MIPIVRHALGIVDAWTRRRVAASVVLSLVLAGLEMTAFGLLYGLLGLIADAGAELPGVVKVLEGIVDADTRSSLISSMAVLTVALLLIKTAIAAAVARWQAGVQAQTESRLAKRLYREYIGQPYLFHVDRNSSFLIRNLTANVGTLSGSVVGGIITTVTEGAVLAGVFVTLAIVEPLLAVSIAAFATLVVAGYLIVITPVIQRAAAREQDLTQVLLQSMDEGFGGIKAVQVFDVAEDVTSAYGTIRDEHAGVRATTTFVQRIPQYYLEACMVVGVSAAAILLSTTQSASGEAYATIGLLIAAALRVLPSVNRFLGALNAIRIGGASVQNLMRERKVGGQLSSDMTPRPSEDRVRLAKALLVERVSFTYPRADEPVLRDVNLCIRAGESVGIVGASGSGKTTLIDLLLGLLVPAQGTVRIDETVLTEANVGHWRRQIGYVPQDTFLMDATILENVVFHRRFASTSDAERAVWRALDEAQLAEFVAGLPGGLAARVGERGTRLSGGQRQRLGIARALLDKPAVLVLDEATSALDADTEKAINDTVTALRGQMTMLIVAHRLSTVRACDRIVIMEAGAVADQGTFDELAKRNATFARMVARSNVATGPD